MCYINPTYWTVLAFFDIFIQMLEFTWTILSHVNWNIMTWWNRSVFMIVFWLVVYFLLWHLPADLVSGDDFANVVFRSNCVFFGNLFLMVYYLPDLLPADSVSTGSLNVVEKIFIEFSLFFFVIVYFLPLLLPISTVDNKRFYYYYV